MAIYSDKLSHQYSGLRHTYTATDERTFSLINKIGISDKKVLDLGCGDGRYAFKLAAMGARSVTGIDISPAMIDIAQNNLGKKHMPNVDFLDVDGSDLPFQNKDFDLVFSNFVLHHFIDTQRPISEIGRVLKSGSYFLGTFNTFEVANPQLFNTEIPLRLGKEKFVVVHNLIKSDEEIQTNLKKAGLVVVDYKEEENPSLSVAPEYTNKAKVLMVKTIICLARK